LQNGLVWFVSYIHIREIVLLPVGCVIVDNPVADHRLDAIIVHDGGPVNVGNPDIVVVIYAIKVVLMHHHRVIKISVISVIQVHRMIIVHHEAMRPPAPAAMAVIRFEGGQWEPTHKKV
jgi:hypothetical protein